MLNEQAGCLCFSEGFLKVYPRHQENCVDWERLRTKERLKGKTVNRSRGIPNAWDLPQHPGEVISPLESSE